MWCHLCKIDFPDQATFCAHIIKKHRQSSKFKEDSSDSEHSKPDETNKEMKVGNSGEEDFLSVDNCSESKSHINVVTPRMDTKIKREKSEFTPRSNIRIKTFSKSNKSTNKQKKPNISNEEMFQELTNYNFPKNQPVSQTVAPVNELSQPAISNKMFCHLCKVYFPNVDIFGIHILKKHKPSSKYYDPSSDSEHSKPDETNMSEVYEEEIEEDNSGEDFFSTDNCSESKSHINAGTPRMNTRVITKKSIFTARNSRRVKTLSKSNQKISKSANKQKKPNILKQGSKEMINDQPVSQMVSPAACSNELSQPSIPDKNFFNFDSPNILLWLQEFKEMFKQFTLPLEPRLFNKIQAVHKAIFDNYCLAQPNEVTSAVFKVYKELDQVIDRHIKSVHEKL